MRIERRGTGAFMNDRQRKRRFPFAVSLNASQMAPLRIGESIWTFLRVRFFPFLDQRRRENHASATNNGGAEPHVGVLRSKQRSCSQIASASYKEENLNGSGPLSISIGPCPKHIVWSTTARAKAPNAQAARVSFTTRLISRGSKNHSREASHRIFRKTHFP